MNYLLTMKNGDEVLDQNTVGLKGLIKLVKEIMFKMGKLNEIECDMHVMSFIQRVDEQGAQAIQGDNSEIMLVVQPIEEEDDVE